MANAHMQCIIGLSTIHGVDPAKIHEFHEKLTSHIQVLETMGKIKEIGEFVRGTLDKLPDIRADLVRLDDNWQEWGFPELIESLRKRCDRNPIPSRDQMPSTPDSNHPHRDPSIRSPPNRGLPIHDSWTQYSSYRHSRNRYPPKKNPAYQTKDESAKVARVCVFRNGEDHRFAECGRFPSISQRRRILSEKKLCFNCTGTRHQAQDCLSKNACQCCGSRHHTSICDRLPNNSQMMLVTDDHEASVIYPVVMVVVDGIKCRALLDTGAGSSYVSAALVERLNKRPTHVEHKQIEMMLCSTIQSYTVKVASVDGKFEMTTKVNKVDKGVLLTVSNPHYEELISKYPHLEGVVMEDNEKKSEWPIYLILGASEYSRIKTEAKPRIGRPSEPIAELTTLGWAMMSSGKETGRRAEDRDVLRFHWIKNKDRSTIEVLRFTRALFGLVQSPFLLAGTLRLHLETLGRGTP